MVGAVCGAGFIGGAEIVKFLGGNFVFSAFFVFVFFSLSLILLFNAANVVSAKRRDIKSDFSGILTGELFAAKEVADFTVKAAAFVLSATSLAAVNDVTKTLLNINFPVFSIPLIIVVYLASNGGTRLLERLNLVLIPILIVVTIVVCVKSGGDYSGAFNSDRKAPFYAALYAFLNCFMNVPVLVNSASKKDKKTQIVCALLAPIIICLLGVMIAATVKAKGSENTQIPLFTAISGSKIFYFAYFAAVITSLFSSACPLFSLTKTKNHGVKFLLGSGIFSLSLIGVKTIVGALYPVLGGFGAVYLFKCFIYGRRRYKNFYTVNNKVKRGYL